MAGNSVSFKANANGLVVVFDKSESFDSICEQISRKLESGGFFFQTRYLAVTYRGRKLKPDEEGKISRLMAEKTGARTVLFEIDKDFDRELRHSDIGSRESAYEAGGGNTGDGAVNDSDDNDSNDNDDGTQLIYETNEPSGKAAEDKVSSAPSASGIAGASGGIGAANGTGASVSARRRYFSMDLDECMTKYHRGTLRSGKLISYDGNVVVVGDVNPGAEVEATGNIIIIGNVRGIVHAGAGGNKEASVIALNFAPTQLRIADIITRRVERKSDAGAGANASAGVGHSPEIAYLRGDSIIVEKC